MSCESYDWNGYALGELDRAARREAEIHAAVCADCREELRAVHTTLNALSALRDGEILVHAFARPPESSARVEAQIDAAVSKAVAAVEARHAEQTERILWLYNQ